MAAPADARPHRTLVQLVETLEATKRHAGLVDPVTDRAVCREFALRVYDRADRADRAGQATAKQVEAFSAAGTFLKALAHFGALDADLERRQQYAEWRAWDLATAIQSGRPPTPVDRGESASAAPGGGFRAPPAMAPAAAVASPPPPTTTTAPPPPSLAPPPHPPAPSSPPPPAAAAAAAAAASAYPSLDALDLRRADPSPSASSAPHAASPPASSTPPPPRELLPSQPHGDAAKQSSAARTRWVPDWGGGGPFAVGDVVLYRSAEAVPEPKKPGSTAGGGGVDSDASGNSPRESSAEFSHAAGVDGKSGGFKIARVVAADHAVRPPAYVVEVDGAERSTEAARLAPPPNPRREGSIQSAAAGARGSEGSGPGPGPGPGEERSASEGFVADARRFVDAAAEALGGKPPGREGVANARKALEEALAALKRAEGELE